MATPWRSACGEEAWQVERRLARTVQFLASDQLAGRGLGTPEIDVAAEFVFNQFEQLGLHVEYQPFTYTKRAKSGPNNRAAFVHQSIGPRMTLEPNFDFRPLALGSAGEIDAPIVFAGYGITAPESDYDDYASVDVRGKVVVVLRHEPLQDDAESPFNGTDHSEHAPFRRKLRNAIDHGAVAVLFCTDLFDIERKQKVLERRQRVIEQKIEDERRQFGELTRPSQTDIERHQRQSARLNQRLQRLGDIAQAEAAGLLPFEGAGIVAADGLIPVMIFSRDSIDRLLLQVGRPVLSALEEAIDRDLAPHSFEFSGWRLAANVDIVREAVPAKNVVATLEGTGVTADETVVVGAHYDHLGRGRDGDADGEIHNGADDNASGVSLLLEIAGHYATLPEPPKRRVVFVAFSGEERGLLGSAHYLTRPVAPLESTVAMLNFDMVGRLADNRLIVSGTQTANEFSRWLDEVNERHGFALKKVPGGMGPSDHASFYAQQIPVLHFFTGLHDEYHRPGDDVQLLNVAGMRRIGEFAREVIDLTLGSPDGPSYTPTDGPSLAK